MSKGAVITASPTPFIGLRVRQTRRSLLEPANSPELVHKVFKRQSTSAANYLNLDLLNPAGPDISEANNQKYYSSILQNAFTKANQGL